MYVTEVSRYIDAPPAAVYQALLDPQAVAKWRAPNGMSCRVHAFDVRIGGAFRISLTYEDELAYGDGLIHEGGLSYEDELTHEDGVACDEGVAYDEGRGNAGKSTARTDTYHGRFVALVPYEKVVEVLQFATDDARFAGTMTITTTLVPTGDGTTVVLVHEGVPDAVPRADNEAGTRMTLTNLARWVEGGG
ncbi:SRPBCC domain-containing protein [Streptomyces sp. WZ-12]|uniref:SRPBCC domain-containing protein n=1 Tax=Streptomyces sp. WZ-12 TaxID=3030210 RepID=UPI0023815279|nr:SRPBCC domain-containing protein [Streptomyces sp. WZ-12]